MSLRTRPLNQQVLVLLEKNKESACVQLSEGYFEEDVNC